MPWKNTSAMDQKSEFITLWESNNYSFSALCRAFSISRTAGYKIVNRYKEFGPAAIVESSRAPFSQPNRTPVEIEEAIIDLRKDHKKWGHESLIHFLSHSSQKK